MNLRHRKRQWMGVVGGLGVVIALGGLVGGWYPLGTTIALTFGVWIMGAVLVNLFCD